MFGQICFLPLFTTIVSVSCYAEFLKTDEVQQDIAENQNNISDENRTSILSEMEFPSAQTPRFVVEDYSATPVLPYTPIVKHVQPLATPADNSTRKWRRNRGERVTTKYQQFRKGPISRRGKKSHQTSCQLMAPILLKQGASNFIVSRNMPKASKKKWLQQFLKRFGEDKSGDVKELHHTYRQKRLREIASLFLQFHPNASERSIEANSASGNRNIKTNEDLKQEELDDTGDNIFEASKTSVSSETSSDEDDDSKSNSDDIDDKFENNSDDIDDEFENNSDDTDDKFENYYSQEGENNDKVDDSDSNRKHNKSSSAVEVSNSLSVTDRLKQIQDASFSVSKRRGQNPLQQSKLQNQARHPRTSRHYHAHCQRRLERKETKSTGLQKRKNSKRHQRKFNRNSRRSVLAQFSKSKTRQGVVTNRQTVSPLNKQDDTDEETDNSSEDDTDEETDKSSEDNTDEETDNSSEEDGSLNKKNDKSYDSSMSTTDDDVKGVLDCPEAKNTDKQPNSLSKSSREKKTSMKATPEAKEDTKRIKDNIFQTNYSIDKSDSTQQGKSVARDKTVIMDSSQNSSPLLTSVHGVYVRTVLTNDSQIHGFGFVTLDAKSKSPSSLPTSLRIQHKKVNASGTGSIPARESILKRQKRDSDLEHQVNNGEKYVRPDSPQNQQRKPRVKRNWFHSAGTLNNPLDETRSERSDVSLLQPDNVKENVKVRMKENVKEQANAENGHIKNGDNKDINNTITSARRFTHAITYPSRKNKINSKRNVFLDKHSENEDRSNQEKNGKMTPDQQEQTFISISNPSVSGHNNTDREIHAVSKRNSTNRDIYRISGRNDTNRDIYRISGRNDTNQDIYRISGRNDTNRDIYRISGRNNTNRDIYRISGRNDTNRDIYRISGRNNTNRDIYRISGHNNTDQGIQHANLQQRKEGKQGQLEQLSGQDRKERKGKRQNQRRNSRRGSLYGHMSDKENSRHKKNKKKNGNKPGLQNTKPLPKLPTVHRVSSVGQKVATVYKGSNSSNGDEITEGVISRAGMDGYGWEYKFNQPSTSRIFVTVHSNRSAVPSQTKTSDRFEGISGSIAGSVDGDSVKVLDKRPADEVSHNTEFVAHDNKISHHDKSNVTVAVRSPFINHRTAYDFLSSRTRSRTSQNMDNEMQRERVQFGHTISEGLCEIFNKHFVPTSIGGRCE